MLKPSEPVHGAYSHRRPFPTLPTTHEPRPAMHTTPTELERWARVKQRLRVDVGDDVFSSWFMRMDLDGIDEETVRLSVPTKFLKSWIQGRYLDRILVCWRAEQPGLRRVELNVRTAVIRTQTTAKPERPCEANPEIREAAHDREPRMMLAPPSSASDALGGSPLDPRLTFESFVVGRSNTLAHAAAKQVAQGRRGEPLMFNPFYIHAGVGLGKTHLLQAIAWSSRSSPPARGPSAAREERADNSRRILYLTVEKFMYGFVAALKSQTAIAFKESLRGIDVLVIDDLQFLQGKSTQAEFCHTLNALIDAGRQVVIASDRPPSDLETLDERVRSRLAGGLVVEIGSHEEELRLEILKSRVAAARAHHTGFDVPAGVLEFIAKTVTHNGRDLDGALNRLIAHNKLTGQPITIDMAERAVRDLVRPQEPKRVKIEDIQRTVARQYNISRADLLSSRRTANVVRPRQIAMYLAKSLTLRSLPEIGRRFGGRDHTTVLHAVRKIEGLVVNDATLAEEIEVLKRLLQE